jgi:hypothetical protein
MSIRWIGHGGEPERTILRRVEFCNGQLPQSARKGRTPIDTRRDWQRQRPEPFKKRPHDHLGCGT